MSKELIIDDKFDIWIPAFKAVSSGGTPICPRCNGKNLEVQAENFGENTGYVLITCNDCNRSGYFSRVLFDNYKGKVENKALAEA